MKFPLEQAPRGSLDEKSRPVFSLLISFHWNEDGKLSFTEDWFEGDFEQLGVWELVGALERIKFDLLLENRRDDEDEQL